MTSDLLESLGRKHGTDKLTHGYLPHYAQRLGDDRESLGCLLEIGVHEGASLRMWHDYLPSARIVGLEIEPKWFPGLDYPRATVCTGNQADRMALQTLCESQGPFDVVVDDGSHRARDHRTSFEVLWPFVTIGGWYAVEDLHSLWDVCWTEPGEMTILDRVLSSTRSVLVGGDSIQEVHLVGGNWDDGILFIRKRSDDYVSRDGVSRKPT